MVPGADAATRGTTDFTDHRVGLDSSAENTELAVCPTTVAVDVMAHVEFTEAHGIFIGVRDVQCGDDTRFGAETEDPSDDAVDDHDTGWITRN
jgi:hypothetical protein